MTSTPASSRRRAIVKSYAVTIAIAGPWPLRARTSGAITFWGEAAGSGPRVWAADGSPPLGLPYMSPPVAAENVAGPCGLRARRSAPNVNLAPACNTGKTGKMARGRFPHYPSGRVRQPTPLRETSREAPFGNRFAWLGRLVSIGCTACVAAAAGVLVGCERPPDAESLKEWTPIDHHSQDDDKVAAGAQVSGVGPKGSGDAQLVEIAWRQQCSSCHGLSGKGDGQMGPMVQAPDLSRDDWQGKVTDAEMAAIIKSGKNRMPKFDLPDGVLRGLVARVRSLRERP